MIIMPPSSITVSIITAEEKLKMEKDKTLMLTGNHDYENKRPSLEIVRVNGPPATPPAVAEVPKASPKPREERHEDQQPTPRPRTKKPVPAVIPIKSAKPSITIMPHSSKSPSNSNNNNNNNNDSGGNSNNNNGKHDEMKTSVTISLENGSQNDSALDLSGKSSRKDGGQQQQYPVGVTNSGNKCVPSHVNGNGSGQYEPSGMRNLMTLSDTAVHLRNMMSSSCKDQQQQLQQQHQQQQQDAKKRFNNTNGGHFNNNGNGPCSPKRQGGSVPLRIPVPPTSGSFGKSSPASSQQNKSVKVAASRAADVKPKHGPPNQAVRHIPNPSVLLFRHHQQQLQAQFAAAAAASAVAANNNNNMNNMNNNKSRIPPHPMPAAIPLHTIRKMENMKNIEKVAAGLSVKANALYK